MRKNQKFSPPVITELRTGRQKLDIRKPNLN